MEKQFFLVHIYQALGFSWMQIIELQHWGDSIVYLPRTILELDIYLRLPNKRKEGEVSYGTGTRLEQDYLLGQDNFNWFDTNHA